MINNFFLAVIIFFSLMARSGQVLAQEEPAIQDSKMVFETQSFSQDIRQLTLQYRGELEEYRKAEQEYNILKQQYQQLGTLVSLEKAVRATQEAMVVRARVLQTYVRLLRFYLLSQAGIELPQKQVAEQNLLDTLSKIEQHQQELIEPLDKLQMRQAVFDFQELSMVIEESIYRVFSLLAVGKLQTVHDKAIVLKEDMKDQLATAGGALKLAERQRSFDETDRVLNSLKSSFDKAEAVFVDSHRISYKGVYKSNNNQLSLIYSSLSKALVFLGELLKI
ncbi:hypothetical protein KKE34_04100 [Patescibacteria group bacterium]|nr:hypothetical protein [Patescibacteria group bacterium]